MTNFLIDWRDITPRNATSLDLTERTWITAPVNENGDRCPWPWDSEQLAGQPIGMFHCPFCGMMVMAGMRHPDYADA